MEILKGIKVVDITAWAFVPSAGGVLAHWGADVIKIESPLAPDPMRLLGGSLEPGRSSPTFKHYSRGKRSIAINLATAEGQELVYKLAADADVFLTSYLGPTRRKLKIDVEDIRKVNPRIIYARGSGHGAKGPDADRPGYDALSWWYRGSLGQTAMDITGAEWPPTMVGHGDGMSGLVFAGGICAALLHRELSGESIVVDSSLLGTAIWFNAMAIMGMQSKEGRPPPGKVQRPAKSPGVAAEVLCATATLYQTKDYRFINLLFLGDDDRDFADLCQRIERPELASDPRFEKAAQRFANSSVLIPILEEVFAAKTLEEWKPILARARGAWAPVQRPEEIGEDPQAIANGFMRHVDYPGGGVDIPTPPIQFNEDTGEPPRAPDFAEHTDEILAELGCDGDAIRRYRESGTVV